MSAFICGIDIGYSNVKLALGTTAQQRPSEFLFPAGAGPTDHLPESIGRVTDGVDVPLDDTTYRALIDPVKFENWPRSLHQDYASTRTYQALYRAGLLKTGQSAIDVLVTGLPVNQYFHPGVAEKLQHSLTGKFRVSDNQEVTVNDCLVIPQPLGSFLTFAENAQHPERLQHSTVLVVDPGFFSVDWVVIAHQDIRRSASGTSTHAASYLLEEASKEIVATHGGKVPRERIEAALRAGENQLYLFGKTVKLQPYLEKAAKRAARAAFDRLRTDVRQEAELTHFDFVLVAGGAAALYQDAAAGLFDHAEVSIVSNNPVMANARGFWNWGLEYAKNRSAA